MKEMEENVALSSGLEKTMKFSSFFKLFEAFKSVESSFHFVVLSIIQKESSSLLDVLLVVTFVIL